MGAPFRFFADYAVTSPSLFLLIGLFLIPIGSLVPNHYVPWPAFHGDAVAIGSFALAAFASLDRRRASLWPAIAVLFAACALIPVIQLMTGLIYFLGDAVVASLYLFLFALAIVVGRSSADKYSSAAVLDPLMLGVAVAGLTSVAIAGYQFLRLSGLGIFAADLPPGGRPFGNLAQPNLFATLTMLLLVASHYFYERSLLSRPGLLVACGIACLGAAMSQSRTAWLQLPAYFLWLTLTRRRCGTRLSSRMMLAIALLFMALVLLWPTIADALYLAAGRDLNAQAQGGMRLIHWATLIDALGRSPIFGYGWNQVAVAQAQTAAAHAWTGEFIDHSHDLLLDLLVWNGIPLGLGIIGAVAAWLVRHARRVQSPIGQLMWGAIAIVLIHSLVEYPLDYAFFLLPVGLFMGILESVTGTRFLLELRPAIQGVLCFFCFAMLGWVAFEYLDIEANARTFRLEAARIGTATIQSKAPDVVLLTQQREFLRDARTEPSRGMSSQELDRMLKVSNRFGYAPTIFRYAWAAAINGHPEVAADALLRLCKTHSVQRCVEGRKAWHDMAAGRFPEFALIQYPSDPSPPKP